MCQDVYIDFSPQLTKHILHLVFSDQGSNLYRKPPIYKQHGIFYFSFFSLLENSILIVL